MYIGVYKGVCEWIHLCVEHIGAKMLRRYLVAYPPTLYVSYA